MAGKTNTKRKDSNRIVLKKGESQRENGTYCYRWTDLSGKRRAIYAKTLPAYLLAVFLILSAQALRQRMHFDARNNSHGCKQSHNGRTAITEKRQCQSDHRHHKQAHTYVLNDLEHQHTSHTHADIRGKGRMCLS